MKRLILTCSECGSANLTRDAIAAQSDSGVWEFLRVDDKNIWGGQNIWCNHCGVFTSVDENYVDVVEEDDTTNRLTWKKLRDIISTMTEEQMVSDVTIYLNPEDEFFACNELKFSVQSDVLDDGHPYLEVNTEF